MPIRVEASQASQGQPSKPSHQFVQLNHCAQNVQGPIGLLLILNCELTQNSRRSTVWYQLGISNSKLLHVEDAGHWVELSRIPHKAKYISNDSMTNLATITSWTRVGLV